MSRFGGNRQGAGGTPGGLGEFLFGLVMVVAGGYLLTNQVTVTSHSWRFGGYSAFGIALLPLAFGIGLLFYNGRSLAGWLLTFGGALVIVLGIITNLDIYFRATSLFNTLVMLVLLAAGLGMIGRSLRSH